jgi:lipoprotein-anchoring transpeptidase ErfK/SrfK
MRTVRLTGLLVVIGAVLAPVALAQTSTAPVPAPPVPAPPVPAPPVPAPPVPVVPAPLPAGVIAPGVTIDGVDVSGLTRVPATQKVIAERVAPKRAPLIVTFRGRRIPINPIRAGYVADVRYAVRGALAFGRTHRLRPAVDVPLREKVNIKRIRAILRSHAERLNLEPLDAAISFKGAKPVFRKPRIGKLIDLGKAERVVADAILERTRNTLALPQTRVAPSVTTAPPAILIERYKFRLTLFNKGKRQVFGIAIGQPAHPTPTGSYSIIQKQVDPTWFPPDSPWAEGLGPVPPGVSNPLGTRWMGTSAPAIGIHGTPLPGSIGSAASHGCIRMRIPDAEYLYDRVEIGTPVIIV